MSNRKRLTMAVLPLKAFQELNYRANAGPSLHHAGTTITTRFTFRSFSISWPWEISPTERTVCECSFIIAYWASSNDPLHVNLVESKIAFPCRKRATCGGTGTKHAVSSVESSSIDTLSSGSLQTQNLTQCWLSLLHVITINPVQCVCFGVSLGWIWARFMLPSRN